MITRESLVAELKPFSAAEAPELCRITFDRIKAELKKSMPETPEEFIKTVSFLLNADEEKSITKERDDNFNFNLIKCYQTDKGLQLISCIIALPVKFPEIFTQAYQKTCKTIISQYDSPYEQLEQFNQALSQVQKIKGQSWSGFCDQFSHPQERWLQQQKLQLETALERVKQALIREDDIELELKKYSASSNYKTIIQAALRETILQHKHAAITKVIGLGADMDMATWELVAQYADRGTITALNKIIKIEFKNIDCNGISLFEMALQHNNREVCHFLVEIKAAVFIGKPKSIFSPVCIQLGLQCIMQANQPDLLEQFLAVLPLEAESTYQLMGEVLAAAVILEDPHPGVKILIKMGATVPNIKLLERNDVRTAMLEREKAFPLDEKQIDSTTKKRLQQEQSKHPILPVYKTPPRIVNSGMFAEIWQQLLNEKNSPKMLSFFSLLWTFESQDQTRMLRMLFADWMLQTNGAHLLQNILSQKPSTFEQAVCYFRMAQPQLLLKLANEKKQFIQFLKANPEHKHLFTNLSQRFELKIFETAFISPTIGFFSQATNVANAAPLNTAAKLGS